MPENEKRGNKQHINEIHQTWRPAATGTSAQKRGWKASLPQMCDQETCRE